jgi:hypothetical protein
MEKRTYQRGIYHINNKHGDAQSPIVWYDGTHWWLPGWECAMNLSSAPHYECGAFSISESEIGELILAHP